MAERIMIVDDEVSNIDALCDILCPEYNVIVAKNGASAITMAEKHIPDLIMLDIIMPDMTGFEVIAKLKHSNLTNKIPVIFITGLDDIKNEEKGLLLGAVDYITKPFSGSIVKARVKTHLQIVEYINTIENMCMIDALTGLANRRYLDSQLPIEWERAAREATAIAFIMIDIDHFKNYNDTYGHPQGDTLLKAAAAVFKKSLFRPADLVARWGGEEFAVLLPETNMNGAIEVAERIRKNIEQMDVICTDGTVTKVTISLGVNSREPVIRNNIGLENFVALADKALYVAKKTGRNCVRSTEGLDEEISC